MSQISLSSSRAFAVTATLGLLSLFPPLATDMYLAALGDLATSMDATNTAAELSLSLFFLGLCFGQILIGPLTDTYGRKGPLLIGTVLFTVTSLVSYRPSGRARAWSWGAPWSKTCTKGGRRRKS